MTTRQACTSLALRFELERQEVVESLLRRGDATLYGVGFYADITPEGEMLLVDLTYKGSDYLLWIAQSPEQAEALRLHRAAKELLQKVSA